eukprot:2858765-Amphidinium_carterae.1
MAGHRAKPRRRQSEWMLILQPHCLQVPAVVMASTKSVGSNRTCKPFELEAIAMKHFHTNNLHKLGNVAALESLRVCRQEST